MATKKKPKKMVETEPFFKDLVSVYFNFCRDKLGDNPTFDNSSPRDFKSIIKTLRERAIKSEIEWTLDTAQQRLHYFLEWAFKDKWLSENWLLFNINRQKDKIFFNIRKSINRTPVDPFE
jgi:hypothetical protein